jgi:hypothetical protein
MISSSKIVPTNIENRSMYSENTAIEVAQKAQVAHDLNELRLKLGTIKAVEQWPDVVQEVYRQCTLISQRPLFAHWNWHESQQARTLRVDTGRGMWIELALNAGDVQLATYKGIDEHQVSHAEVLGHFFLYPSTPPTEWTWREGKTGEVFAPGQIAARALESLLKQEIELLRDGLNRRGEAVPVGY